MSDADYIHLILQNLISNATKYTMEKGEITVSLDIARQKSIIAGKMVNQDSLLISVNDTGIGIPEDSYDKIFTKFFRAENARKYDTIGNGLGLYMAKKLVSTIGGTIWFTSEENKGTTFYVLFPIGEIS